MKLPAEKIEWAQEKIKRRIKELEAQIQGDLKDLETMRVEKHELTLKTWKKVTDGRHRNEFATAANQYALETLKPGDIVKVASSRSPYKMFNEVNKKDYTSQFPYSFVFRALTLAPKAWNAHKQIDEITQRDIVCGDKKFALTNNFSENNPAGFVEIWRDGEWKKFKSLVPYDGWLK